MEIWKEIEGYNGFYSVSNYGRVKSNGGNCGSCIRKEKILSQSKTRDGYMKVRLMHKNKDKTMRVHRLVANAFIENPYNKETVNHIDGNKENNNVNNLEWSNRSEQLIHAYKNKLKESQKGCTNKNSKLTEYQIKEIRNTYIRNSKEFGTVALSKKYGVTDRVIGLIVRNLSYKNVN